MLLNWCFHRIYCRYRCKLCLRRIAPPLLETIVTSQTFLRNCGTGAEVALVARPCVPHTRIEGCVRRRKLSTVHFKRETQCTYFWNKYIWEIVECLNIAALFPLHICVIVGNNYKHKYLNIVVKCLDRCVSVIFLL